MNETNSGGGGGGGPPGGTSRLITFMAPIKAAGLSESSECCKLQVLIVPPDEGNPSPVQLSHTVNTNVHYSHKHLLRSRSFD